uniref:Putative ovule protein n=1 Tax=Solanum chacoense TaxID=4108 RepID=A0A0V0GLN2_SOLCH
MQGSKITSDRVLLHSTLRPLNQNLSQMIDYCMCNSSVTLVHILCSQPRKKWNHEPMLGCLSQFDECAHSQGDGMN